MSKEPRLKIDNPVFAWMGTLGDVIALNLLWLLCCLPVVTIGVSTTALFYVARKISAGEEYRVCRDFFHSLRSNWKQATLLWLAELAVGMLFAADLWIGLHTDSGMGNFFRGAGGVLLILWLAQLGFAFPLLARYDYRLGQLAMDCLRLTATKPYIAVVHVLLVIWLPALLFLSPELFLFLMPPWLLCGAGASAAALSRLLLPVQREIESKGKDTEGAS